MNEYKLQLKEELEALYNKLLMQHESLPSEVHKEWNTQAMDVVDSKLMELERELTIDIEAPVFEEEQAEVVIVKAKEATTQDVERVTEYKIYSDELHLVFEQQDETTLIIHSYDKYGQMTTKPIARFNFMNGCGYYVTQDDELVNVGRFKTILNHFEKVNDFFSWDSEMVDKLKKNVRKVKYLEKKAEKEIEEGLAV